MKNSGVEIDFQRQGNSNWALRVHQKRLKKNKPESLFDFHQWAQFPVQTPPRFLERLMNSITDSCCWYRSKSRKSTCFIRTERKRQRERDREIENEIFRVWCERLPCSCRSGQELDSFIHNIDLFIDNVQSSQPEPSQSRYSNRITCFDDFGECKREREANVLVTI